MESKEKIKYLLGKLPSEQQEQLRYAHSHLISQYYVLRDGSFIGVHCENIPHLIIESNFNDWYSGQVKTINSINQGEILNNGYKKTY